MWYIRSLKVTSDFWVELPKRSLAISSGDSTNDVWPLRTLINIFGFQFLTHEKKTNSSYYVG